MTRLPALLDPRGVGAAVAGFALLVGIAALAAAAAFVLGVEARRIETMARVVTVAVADQDPAARTARAGAVAAMMRARHDLSDVRRADQADAALIDATLVSGADERPLRRALAGQPGIAVYHDSGPLDGLGRLLRTLEHIAIWIGLATLAGMAAISALAARTRLEAGEATLALLDRLGATGAQIAALVARPARREALVGGVAGLVAALFSMLAIAAALRSADVGAVSTVSIAPAAWAILAALPPLAAGIATLAAQATALTIWARRR